jgi:hypothetical protein
MNIWETINLHEINVVKAIYCKGKRRGKMKVRGGKKESSHGRG